MSRETDFNKIGTLRTHAKSREERGDPTLIRLCLKIAFDLHASSECNKR
jgi:hypothetical protein